MWIVCVVYRVFYPGSSILLCTYEGTGDVALNFVDLQRETDTQMSAPKPVRQ